MPALNSQHLRRIKKCESFISWRYRALPDVGASHLLGPRICSSVGLQVVAIMNFVDAVFKIVREHACFSESGTLHEVGGFLDI